MYHPPSSQCFGWIDTFADGLLVHEKIIHPVAVDRYIQLLFPKYVIITFLLFKVQFSYLSNRRPQPIWISCAGPLLFLLLKDFKLFGFQSFGFECTLGMLFQRPVLRTKSDIYVVIILHNNIL